VSVSITKDNEVINSFGKKIPELEKLDVLFFGGEF
jgi:hypothetical protein